MATARKVHLSPETDSGVFNFAVRQDTAQAASEALQLDMEKHHVFFNDEGFHSTNSDYPELALYYLDNFMILTLATDHIPHSLLSIYALGGSPEDIRAAYERNQAYQLPARPVVDEVLEKLNETAGFKEYRGKGEHYSNFLAFFQRQIEEKGVGAVLNEYLFAENEQAEDMLCRLWAGMLFLHDNCYDITFYWKRGPNGCNTEYRSGPSTHSSRFRS